MENKFKYVDCWKRWKLTHKNVNIEIAFREPRIDSDHDYFRNDTGGWTYYLLLRLDWIKDEKLRNDLWLTPNKTNRIFPDYDYCNSILSNFPWHCGITYYEKKIIADTDIKYVMIGCDYQHFWDEGHIYTKEIVLDDAIETAEYFLSLCPDYGQIEMKDQESAAKDNK